MKECKRCGQTLPFEKFRKRSDGKSDGYTSWCKPCQNERAREKYATPEGKAAYLASKFGISLEDATALAGVDSCQICGDAPGYRALDIDHDHFTGAVRGVLCPNCNTALGLVKDDTTRLKAMIIYLEGGTP